LRQAWCPGSSSGARCLQPTDDATWTAIDGRIDTVLTALRDSDPDAVTERQALDDLLTALK